MIKRKFQPSRFTRAKTATLALAMLAGMSMASAPDAVAYFDLGAFDYYGLLVNSGASGGDINTFPVNANVGIGLVTGSVNLHNGEFNGMVDVLDGTSSVSGPAITGTQPISLGGAPTPSTVNYGVANVGTAINDALNLSTLYGAEVGTAVTINGSTTINASDGLLDGTGTRIFNATSFSIGNGNTVTINGSASDYVVINITGNSGNKLDGALTLTGGITSDHVLINFIGSGANVQGAANKATLEGTFLMPNMGVQLNSLTIAGHLFGGAEGTNFQFVSNALIQQPPLTPPVPIPGIAFLLGPGLAGFAWWRRRFLD